MTPDELERHFQICVAQRGPAYTQARDAIVGAGAQARTWLQAKTTATWQEQLAKDVLQGWLDQGERYTQVGTIVVSAGETDAPARPITGRLSPSKKASILASFGEGIVPRLLEMALKTGELTSHGEKSVVFTALDVLQASTSVLPLVHLASEVADYRTQELALSVLGTLGDERAYAAALAAFTDRAKVTPVRSAAAMALGRIGNREATRTIRTALEDRAEPRDVRLQAAKALGELGDPAASSALASVLRTDPESDLAMSLTVVQALGKIGDATALAALSTVRQASQNATLLAAIDAARGDQIA